MSFIKRSILFLLIALFLVSLYKDLTIGTSFYNEKEVNPVKTSTYTVDFTIVQVKAYHEDTVLSIIEKLNEKAITSLDIEEMIADFQKINPRTDPYNLQPNTYYYFPLYLG